MSDTTSNYSDSWDRRSRAERLIRWVLWLVFVAVFIQSWRIMNEDTLWFFVEDAPRQFADISSRMWPIRWSYMDQLWKPLWDTINIATLGTALGVVIALPIAFLAASNTTPNAYIVRPIALFIIAASRSINSLIWALLLVMVLGPGLLAGIIAIALRSIGFVAKLTYEGIEEINKTQVAAVTATGASSVQVLDYAIIPQILPNFVSTAIFRWDINIRESTVLGMVGAGGIGLQLDASLATLAWPQVALIFIAILGTVVVSESISARVRKALI
ncbi:phosphonate ABC transporter, permease protein PhnE [Rhodobacteraceae bacterium RKSG542]|uniref:phosphonate ABC transporter, permease protein PhnE n=1 Tax=Pseudovibrio flavus TaxID=2529854 RepID=UPI0012BC9CA3|nr:phosphonate ABC transporter, permease protein PhnE [Pseudovibrio flavus]MTI17968.1 phosphonate ABC transporter, permease protein PhnE [Pseudovibrio flavus]